MAERHGPGRRGSGAHGLVFFFGAMRGVGVDPLAADYATLFPAWQPRARTVAAAGERLPFGDASFEVVLWPGTPRDSASRSAPSRTTPSTSRSRPRARSSTAFPYASSMSTAPGASSASTARATWATV
jgi:hypothetical protein